MTKLLPDNDRGQLIERSLEAAWEDDADIDVGPWEMTPRNIGKFIECAETELSITHPAQIREQDYEDAFRKLLNDPSALKRVLEG